MKYLIQWESPQPQAIRATVQHFLKTGGQPPQGATQLGRWFGMNGRGCSLIEASDPKQVFELISEWQEFLPIEATPVVEDEDASQIFVKLYQ
jgi:uncharacterized protein DUF3303